MWETFLSRFEKTLRGEIPPMRREVKEGEVVFLMGFPTEDSNGSALLGLEKMLSAIIQADPVDFLDAKIGQVLKKRAWNAGLMPATLVKEGEYYFAVSPEGAKYGNGLVSEANESSRLYHDYAEEDLYTWGVKSRGTYFEVYELEYVIYRVLHSDITMRVLFPLILHGVSRTFSLNEETCHDFLHRCVNLRQYLDEQLHHPVTRH